MTGDRWAWRTWMGLWAFVILDAVVSFVVGVTATLTDSSRLGYTEIPLLIAGAMSTLVLCVWGDERGAPRQPPSMTRADRARFRRERSRLELAARTRETEIELGIGEASETAEITRLPERWS